MGEARTQVEMFGGAAGAEAPAAGERGPGRPKGAMNRRSRDWQRFVAASGKKHPMEFLLDVVGSTPEELRERYAGLPAPRLDGDPADLATIGPKDLLALQIRAAEAALPYLEQKLPQAIEDVSDKPRTVFVVGTLAPEQAKRVDGRFGLRVIQQNQALSHVIDAKSDEVKVGQPENASKDKGLIGNGD